LKDIGEKEEAAENGGKQNAFIGRTRELSELRAALEESIAGRGGCFLISGEPGIGKTRLADELAGEAASRGMRVVWGRCWEGGGAPAYWPWVEVLRSLILHETRERERHSALAPEIAQLIPELSPETVAPRAPSDPMQARFRLFDAVATLLKQFASSAPLLIVLDDLHEADQGSLELLKFVARGLTDSRIVIVGTHRDAEVRRSPYLSEAIGEILRHGHAIPLAGLDQNEVARMVEDRAQRSPSAAFASELYRVTAGNPLFVDGVVRVLLAERNLGTSDRIDLSGFKLPEDVRGAIRKRLGLLSTQAQSLLTVAAVVGQEFDTALLPRISDLSAGVSSELMDEASEVGVVALSSHDSYRFTHPLLRESLYKSLTEAERRRFHRAIGEALEQLHAANITPHLAALAHHFDQAAAASLDPLQIEKAVEYSLHAGWAAMNVEAWEEALVHFHAGLRHAEKGQDSQTRQAEFLAGIAYTRAWSDRTSEGAATEIESAVELCEERGLLEQAGKLRTLTALRLCKDDDESHTDISRAMTHFEPAQRELEHATDSLWLYVAMALAGWKSLDTVRGMEVSQLGLKMSERLQEPDFVAHFSDIRAQLLAHTGRIAEALATPIDRNSSESLPRQLEMTGRILSRLWDPAHGKPWLLEGVRLPAVPFVLFQSGFGPNTDFRALDETLAIMHVMTGNLEDAQALVDRAPSTLLRGIIGIHGGDWTAAKSVLETGLSITRASGARERHADLSFWYARLLRITGQTARARAFLDDALQIFGEGSLPLVELWLRPECILALEGKDAAQSHRARCREILASQEDWRGLVGAVARAEAVVAAADNRIQDAETFFERAIATFTRYSLPWEQAETLLLWGRMLAAGDERRANEKFGTAIEIYRRYGAGRRWLERVQEARSCRQRKDSMAEDRPASSSSPAENIFRKDGDFWTVTHGGRTFRLRNLKGLEYIAYLLAHPGVRIHACDLVAMVEGRALHDAAASVGHAQAQGLVAASDLGDAGEALDAQAVSSYRRRLTEVRAELAEAERNNDTGAKERAQREFEALSDQLASAVGRHGRVRRSSSHVERARALVTKNIRASVERIRRNDAKLAEHFASSIRTGAFCAYLPQLEDKQSWQM
jgi:hypothetical protein